jgi:preprotein translocase SecA subunit
MFKWLGNLIDSNEKVLKKLQPIVEKINSFEPEYGKLSADELKAKTQEFKDRLAETTVDIQQRVDTARQELQEAKKGLAAAQDEYTRGNWEASGKQLQEKFEQLEKELWKAQNEALEEVLPEAFAAVREAAKRTIGQRHFDVQLMGGMVLHQGRIAEMKTGEGKTLVATLPLYLNSLTGKGVHLVTVNDYLSKRDSHWMGPIYHALGMKVACIQHESSFIIDPDYYSGDVDWPYIRPVGRREAYAADITYGTNNEFGFDYLRDNMVVDLNQCVQRDLNYAIVDEVDNILIDEARTPLIISGTAAEGALQKYSMADKVARQLTGKIITEKEETEAKQKGTDIEEGLDYLVDEKNHGVRLTGEGVSKAQAKLNVDSVHEFQLKWEHYVRQAIIAHELYKKNREYVVNNGKVVIVDEFTGRMMEGRRYSDGLHQAIEAKEIANRERVQVEEETRTYATVTFQNYFRMYQKLAGMTGTALTEAEEFHKIYKLEVVQITTYNKMIRDDAADRIYKNEESKFRAVAKQVEELYKQKTPVLIGTVSVEKSMIITEKYLKPLGIPYERLNAKDHAREAGIIAQAGRLGAVTVATNMAGRGVDIILGGNPEGLAKEQLRKENRGRVEKEFGGDLKNLEDLKSGHDKRMKQLDAEYVPRIKALEEKKDKAVELLQTLEEKCRSSSPFFERFKKLEAERIKLTEAESQTKLFPEDYRTLEKELEEILFEEAKRVKSVNSMRSVREVLRNADKVAKEYQISIHQYNASISEVGRITEITKGGSSPQLVSSTNILERAHSEMVRARLMWLKVLKELELAIVSEIMPAQVQELDRTKEVSLKVSADLEKEQNNYENERIREEKTYETKKEPHESKIDSKQKQIENGPEYRERFNVLFKKYSPVCVSERDKVIELGGLHVIGTERHEARRIDLQLRGRAGRQGDPGSTQFYVSLEDDIMRRFGGDRVGKFMEWAGIGEDIPIENSIVNKAIEGAQVRVEGYHFDVRKHLVDYDDVVNNQRKIIYGERRKILSGADLRTNVLSMVKEEMADIIASHTGESGDGNLTQLVAEVKTIMPVSKEFNEESLAGLKPNEIEDQLLKQAESLYEKRETELAADSMRMLERLLMLRIIDNYWVEHLTNMDNMRQGVGLHAVAQRDPLAVYKNEGHELFEGMMAGIRHDLVHNIFNLNITKGPPTKQTASPMAKAAVASRASDSGKPAEKVAGKKIGRNDPCPCGSGKKYKHCCGKSL